MHLDPSLTASYIFLAATLALSPGPDVMFVVANGMSHGAKGALASAVGIGAGSFLRAVLASIGISAFVAASPFAFTVMKIVGALYLACMGVQAIRSAFKTARSAKSVHKIQDIPAWSMFLRGFMTNILNPKVVIFYLALLPQFVREELGHVGIQVFLLGCIHNVIGVSFLIVIGLAAGKASNWIGKTCLGRWLDGVAGVLFLGLAARLAFKDGPNG